VESNAGARKGRHYKGKAALKTGAGCIAPDGEVSQFHAKLLGQSYSYLSESQKKYANGKGKEPLNQSTTSRKVCKLKGRRGSGKEKRPGPSKKGCIGETRRGIRRKGKTKGSETRETLAV